MPSSTYYKTGYDKRNKKVLSWRRKAARDWEAVTSPESSLQSLAAATGNARSPTVTSRVGRTSKASMADERRRRMSATWVSWADRYSGGLCSVDNDKPMSPAWTWYAQPHEASVDRRAAWWCALSVEDRWLSLQKHSARPEDDATGSTGCQPALLYRIRSDDF